MEEVAGVGKCAEEVGGVGERAEEVGGGMSHKRGAKSRKRKTRKRYEDRMKEQAANRRKLLAKLDTETARWVERDFAQLGLFQ